MTKKESRTTKSKNKHVALSRFFSRIGIISGFIAVIAFPASPILAPLFCSGVCDLDNFKGMYYLGVFVFITGLIGITGIILSEVFRRIK